MATINDLDGLNLNVEVAAPSEYVDGNMPMLVPEGKHTLVITDWDISRNYETKQPDGKAFVLQCQVQGGDYDGRYVRNLRVWTTTFQRNGVTVSGLGDLIRALDDSAQWTSIAEAGAIIQKAMDQKLPFEAKLRWEAFDSDYYNDQGGPSMVNKSPEQKALRKQSTIVGMHNFRQAADGTFLPETEGPSGGTIEARVVINSYTPSSKRR